MTVYGMMGPSRFVLVIADGPTIMFEFAGCDHLSNDLVAVDEVRTTTTITANSGSAYRAALTRFAGEIAAECRHHHPDQPTLAVEKVDFEFVDALRADGLRLVDATGVLLEARRIKQQFHRDLIANDGEYVVARLFQSGPNTFPYFRESGCRALRSGDLVCLDTDATGYMGYAVDFSRTFACGVDRASPVQRDLFALALEQLRHNAELVAPGVTYEEFARRAWPVPERHRPYGYYCLAHGIGVAGEHPNVPLATAGEEYPFAGGFEQDMVICIESYIGDPASHQGVKLEDQYVVTATGVQAMSSYPFSEALM
jgi:Xaa-Pro aminopeptidase